MQMIKDLTELENIVLMSVKRIEEVGTVKYNFTAIYEQYMKFITGGAQTTDIDERDIFRDKLMLHYPTDRDIVYKAFDHLIDLQLLKLTSSKTDLKKKISNVRLNEIHPSEIQNFVQKNADSFSSEIYKYATE